jgi:hypothetical protein
MTPEVRGLFQGQAGPPPDASPANAAAAHDPPMIPLVIDCDRCSMRGVGCDDCVVSVLLGGPPNGTALDETEQQALDVLAEAGLVPPLRMVEARQSRSERDGGA